MEEYRMYHLVMYNLSPIQKAIQAYHSGIVFATQSYGLKEFYQWATKDQTIIILDGGTSNENMSKPGTMQEYYGDLRDNDIFCTAFHEPDLNDTMSAMAFLVPERVWNYEKYPDWETIQSDCMQEMTNINDYDDWERMIGGKQNAWLREFLKQFKLA